MGMCIWCLIQIALVAESQLLRLGVIQKLFKQIRMDKIQYTGWPGKCSPQQLKTLAAFREHVEKMGINATAFDDAYLLRFLRARKFDLEKTIKMWTDFINWRIENHVDTIETIKLPEIPQVRKCYPHGYHKTDKFFRPIYIERVGKLNIDELWKHTKQERMLQYYTLSYETLLKKIFPSCTAFKNTMNNDGVAVTQTLTILDLKDVSLTSAPKAYSFIKPASKLAQDNYPQMLGTMFIINAPFLFKGVWLMIKPWLDEKTTNKIKILGSSYKKELLQFVDAQNIPDFLDGGKCKCPGNGGDCLSWNIGPWNPQGKELFQYAVEQ